MGTRIGVDVGGTFTDVCLFDEVSKSLHVSKVPSVPSAPEKAIIAAIGRALSESHTKPEDVAFVAHGTTVATNAIIEYKGARVGILVTEGFRDILQIIRQDRPKLYDYFAQRAPPLVLRRHTYEVKERILHTGDVETPLDEPATRQLLRRVKKSGLDILAVCLLHSYANPVHEHRIRELVRQEIPGIEVCLSSDILPEIKEYERAITTVVNAYVLPIVSSYLSGLEQQLRSAKLGSALYIMQSNGGMMTASTAAEKSVRTVLSGPAAGALAAMWIGKKAGFQNLISIDMGGTSADVSLMNAGELTYTQETGVAGHAIKLPTIDINSVGAGGGSIAWIDAGKALQVGPASAGAYPGPACYARGGNDPTVTDANLVLGRLNPEFFLGGEMKVDVEAARQAITDKIAKPLGLGLEQAAEGILRIVNATMVRGIRRVSVEKGHDPREFTLFAFGGGGPLHASMLAAELGIPKILVPAVAGVCSAMGCIVADFRHDYAQTLLGDFNGLSPERLQAAFTRLENKALDQMAREGFHSGRVMLLRSLDLRYAGQGYELEVPILTGTIDRSRMDQIDSTFRALFRKTYGYSADDATEVVTVRVVAVGNLPAIEFPRPASAGTSDAREALKGQRRVFYDGVFHDTCIYDGYNLDSGSRAPGPAVIELRESTIIVFPQQVAKKDESGNFILTWQNAETKLNKFLSPDTD